MKALSSSIPQLALPYAFAHPLQSLDLYYQNPDSNAHWVIFIHGGAWRDPLMTKSTGTPLLLSLLTKYPLLNAASVNYRLSPHPHHQDTGNAAKHPDHLNDVRSAVSFLEGKYGMTRGRCVLVGHSAGAYMAFRIGGVPVGAVVGVEGIYHLRSLVAEYAEYEEFIAGAFGDAWAEVDEDGVGEDGEVRAVLVHSSQDELLSFEQARYWARALRGKGRVVREVFDAMWSHNGALVGGELVRVLEEELMALGMGAN